MNHTLELDQNTSSSSASRAPSSGFGSPFERNGATIIPVSRNNRPIGVYVLDGKTTTYMPAVDLARMIPVMLLGEITAILMLGIIRSLVKRRST